MLAQQADTADSYLGDMVSELRNQALRNLLYLKIVGTLSWHAWQGIRTPAQYAPDRGILIVPLLLTDWLLLCLLARRWRGAAALFLATSLVWASITVALFDGPDAMFLYSILALSAVVISGPGAGLLTAAAGSAAASWLGTYGGPSLRAAPRGLTVGLASFGVVIVGWLLSRHFQLALDWSLASYREARESLRAIRERRAEVVHLNQELERAREKLERANAALVRAWRAAEEAERKQQQLTAFVSHELRTPLNLVIGFSEILATSPETYEHAQVPPKMRRDINAVYRSAQQVAALLDDVLDMTSAGYGYLTLMREPADVWHVIEEAATLVRDYAEARGLYLELVKEAEAQPLFIDRLRIRQVLLNLLINAARFTSSGTITVRLAQQPAATHITVTDTGQGIPPERLERIFVAYQSSEGLQSSWGKGTGLGLPLSRQLIRLHGGDMGVDSTVGAGTTFWFTLPHEPGNSPPLPATPARGAASAPAARDLEPSVVVLDDGQTLVRRLRRLTQRYHLTSAQTWEDARRQAEELHALAVVASQGAVIPEAVPAIPVIRCPLPSAASWAQRLKVAAYLAKPIKAAQLLGAIAAVAPGAASILVVDDDERFVQLLARVLEGDAFGCYAVHAAHNGEEALEKLGSLRPDLLLLDLALPKLDGRQVLAHKARDAHIAAIPTIVISAPQADDELEPAGNTFSLVHPDGLNSRQVSDILDAVLGTLSQVVTDPETSAGGPPAIALV